MLPSWLPIKELKAKVYLNLEDDSIRIITEDGKEYSFSNMEEALSYFEGLGYFDIRITELFLSVPGIERTIHLVEKPDPRSPTGYVLKTVIPLTEEEKQALEKTNEIFKLLIQREIDHSYIS